MTETPTASALDPPIDASWLDREEAPLTLLFGGLAFMAGKKKSHKRCSAVGCDEQGSLLVSVKSLGEGSNICLVAASGAQQLRLDIKENLHFYMRCLGVSGCLLENILSSFHTCPSAPSPVVKPDLTCLFRRPSSQYKK